MTITIDLRLALELALAAGLVGSVGLHLKRARDLREVKRDLRELCHRINGDPNADEEFELRCARSRAQRIIGEPPANEERLDDDALRSLGLNVPRRSDPPRVLARDARPAPFPSPPLPRPAKPEVELRSGFPSFDEEAKP